MDKKDEPFFLQALNRNELKPVYFFEGSESFLKERALNLLQNLVVPKHLKQLNYHNYNIESDNLHDIINSAQMLPMMSEYRLIIVSSSSELKSDDLQKIKKYIENPSRSSIVVFLLEKPIAKLNITSEHEKNFDIINFQKMKHRDITIWIQQEFRKENKEIHPKEVLILLDFIGDNLRDLYNEILKISIYAKDNRVITSDIIKQVSCEIDSDSIFELLDAMDFQSQNKSLGIDLLFNLLDKDKDFSIQKMVYILNKHYQTLFSAKILLEQNVSESDILKKLKINKNIYWKWEKTILPKLSKTPLNKIKRAFLHLYILASDIRKKKTSEVDLFLRYFLAIS